MPKASVAAVLAVALVAGGCNGDDEGTPAAAGTGVPGEGGALVWALDRDPADLDPLLADDFAAQVVCRQIYEPLVAQLAGPFGDARRTAGLALSARSSNDHTTWRLRLRPGVTFQDGSPFTASVVLANAERWQSTEVGRDLLPQLFEADAPRPDLVRFFLSGSDARFAQRLNDPRLGIVAPRALDPRGGSAVLASGVGAGTGAFELRERDRSRLLLARNTTWWGTGRDLGPALDQVEFLIVPDDDERVELLQAGDVPVANALGPLDLQKLSRDPLLTTLPAGNDGLALERSVRGIDSARVVPPLSEVWLTSIG